jgi:threonyl-tRNA synthetase
MLSTKRHSLAHLLAAAVKELYPQAKLSIGPDIDNGFYYDIDFGEDKINDASLKDLEKKMAHLVKQNLKFKRSEMDISSALAKAESEGEIDLVLQTPQNET